MGDPLHQYLSCHDLSELLSLSQKSLQCRTEDQLKGLVLGLKTLIGFENAICTQANIPDTFRDKDADVAVLNISYPAEFLEIYYEKRYHLTDPVFCSVLTDMIPLNWLTLGRKLGFTSPPMMLARDFGMSDGWAHCTRDPAFMRCTMFFMAGPVIENDVRTRIIIDYITPFFSLAYTRVLKIDRPPAAKLTAKETEVLKWLKEGKSSWEISVILNCSKRVIDFHVTNIKTKLDAVSRAQCVAAGIQHGIISI